MHQSFCHERAAYLIQVGVDVSQNDELVDGNGIIKIYPEINPVQQRDIHSGKSPILPLIHIHELTLPNKFVYIYVTEMRAPQ